MNFDQLVGTYPDFESFAKRTYDLQEQAFSNLFSANHRAAMIRQHGGTQAQIIKVAYNKALGVAEIIN